MCQTVLFHHDSIGIAWIFECCRTTRHPHRSTFADQSASVTLERLRHSHQLSTRRHQHPFYKEQTFFLVQLCFAVLCLNYVKKESVPVSARRSSNTPAERDNQGREWFFEHRTHGESARIVLASGSLNETSRPPSCWSRAPFAVGSKIKQLYVLSWVLDWTLREAVHQCQGSNTLHQLVSLWKTRNWLSHP